MTYRPCLLCKGAQLIMPDIRKNFQQITQLNSVVGGFELSRPRLGSQDKKIRATVFHKLMKMFLMSRLN